MHVQGRREGKINDENFLEKMQKSREYKETQSLIVFYAYMQKLI